MKQKRVWITAGPAGSGKSTWVAERCLTNPEAIKVSRDDIRFSLLKDDEDYFAHESEVWEMFVKAACNCIYNDNYTDIYIDATHLNDKARKKVIDRLPKDVEYEIHIVIFNTPLDTCLERNEKRKGRAKVPSAVIRSMHRALQLTSELGEVMIIGEKPVAVAPTQEPTIWLTSDLHLCHNKDFVWKERGYESVEDMNNDIVRKFNSLVQPNDIVYILGDCMLNDNQRGIELMSQLNGRIKIAIGNHDTDARIDLYRGLENVESVDFGYRIQYKKCSYLLTHYPSIVANSGNEKPVHNLHGHSHQTTKFGEFSHCYHVGWDTFGQPAKLEDIHNDIKAAIKSDEIIG